MSKVICIDGVSAGFVGKWQSDGTPAFCKKDGEIYTGETYTVHREFNKYGNTYYVLEERGEKYGYNVKRFSTLSEIDETTFERNYQKELT